MQRYRLFFCDDLRGEENIIEAALADLDFEIEFSADSDLATSLADACARIAGRNFNYDLVVTDMRFENERNGKQGGFEVLRRVKKQHGDVDVIIMTGYAAENSMADLLTVADIYHLSENTLVRKEGTHRDTGRRLAEAIRGLLPSIKAKKQAKFETERPYRLQFDLSSGVCGVFAPQSRQSFKIRELDRRHFKILKCLASQKHPVGDKELADRLHHEELASREAIIRPLIRGELIDLSRRWGGPVQLCDQHLADDGRSCAHYLLCFPGTTASAIGEKQCPLHWRFWGHPPIEEKKGAESIRSDIRHIRKQTILATKSGFEPLARTGSLNDLLRTTKRGYWLAAVISS